jgi:FdrA protein
VSWETRVIANRYVDSVRLMSAAQTARGRDDVRGCEAVTGTPANLELLAARGIEATAGPSDIVIAVDGDDPAAALDAVEGALTASSGGDTGAALLDPPRSLPSAVRRLRGEANLALISVPGEYATLEAHRALGQDLHVFLFSDHVPLADELALKRRGAERGRLVMGPGCGTAMLGQVGLGFANVVRSGSVGIVAAAGTGAQEVAVLLDRAGVGVSHIVGVGGRDLSEEIGGIMFREGMRMLAADDATDTLLLVSKPPAESVVRALGDVDVGGKRVVAALVGWDGGDAPFEVHTTLDAGAFAAAGAEAPAVEALEAQVDAGPGGRRVLGLFSGGSLAHEAVCLLEPVLGPVGGNAGHGDGDDGHAVFDLGEEEYTQGRPHPMVDLEVRLGFLRERAAREDVGCVLLDVVLGHGAHPDPAGGLAEALAALSGERAVIAHVCGTDLDPQDASAQERTLRDAGVIVAPTSAIAARLAIRAVTAASVAR